VFKHRGPSCFRDHNAFAQPREGRDPERANCPAQARESSLDARLRDFRVLDFFSGTGGSALVPGRWSLEGRVLTSPSEDQH